MIVQEMHLSKDSSSLGRIVLAVSSSEQMKMAPFATRLDARRSCDVRLATRACPFIRLSRSFLEAVHRGLGALNKVHGNRLEQGFA